MGVWAFRLLLALLDTLDSAANDAERCMWGLSDRLAWRQLATPPLYLRLAEFGVMYYLYYCTRFCERET